MTFLAPGLLWGLLALIPLCLIYLLKVRPRRKPTNAFFLWEKILQEKAASALFHRLRDVFSLLLMALIIALIIIAIARPKVSRGDDRDLIIILDQSPSMAAEGSNGTVMELAKEEAAQIVRSLDGTRRLAVIGLADRLNFVSHLSDSPKDLLDAIESLAPSPVPLSETALREVNRLAGNEQSRVILVTDGHGGLETLSDRVETIRVEGPRGNIGIVAADLAWIPGRKDTVSFFYKMASSFPEERPSELILRDPSGGQILRVIPLSVAPGIGPGHTLEIEGITPGSWLAEVEIQDAIQEDNQVVMSLNEQRLIAAAVQSQQPYFFERSLEAFANAGGLVLTSGAAAEVILTDESDAAGERLILFAPKGDSVWWQQLGETLEPPVPIVVAPSHPLLRHLEAESINFAGARDLSLPEGAVVLMKSETGVPLLYKARHESRQAIVVNLDPQAAEFFLSPWFPVLIYDGARNLTGEERSLRSVYPAGSQVEFPRENNEQVTWTQPDGSTSQARAGEVRQIGVHRVASTNGERTFGVGLLQARESLLDGSGPSSSETPIERGRLLSWWLLAIALLLITIESMLYHRRKLG